MGLMDWELHPESPVQLTKNQRKEKTIMNKKRILSALLAVCMVFSMVLCIRTSVCAKTADGIKIVFDGKKSITLNSGSEPKTLKEVEKKWGEKTRLAADDEEYAGYAYVWEKGKSKITIRQPSKEPELNVEDYLGYTSIEISEKCFCSRRESWNEKCHSFEKTAESIWQKKCYPVERRKDLY